MTAKLSSLDSPRDTRIGRWVRQQIEAFKDYAARDVRTVADAHERLLCVVDGVAAELNALKTQAQLKAQADAQTDMEHRQESRKLQELLAGLRPRFEILEGEMMNLRLKEAPPQVASSVPAGGFAAVIMRVTRLESELDARAQRDLSSTESHATTLARLSKLEAELSSKQEATPSHIAEIRQHLYGSLDGSGNGAGLCQRVASLEAETAHQTNRFLGEQRQQEIHLETWQKKLCEGVSGWQHQLASELRAELRSKVQSLAAAISSLDERLWQFDGRVSLEVNGIQGGIQPRNLADDMKSTRDESSLARSLRSPRRGDVGVTSPAAYVSPADELASALTPSLCSPKLCRGGLQQQSLLPQGSSNGRTAGAVAAAMGSSTGLGDRCAGLSAVPPLSTGPAVASEHSFLGASAGRLFEATWEPRVTAPRGPRSPEQQHRSSSPTRLHARLGNSPMSCFLKAEQQAIASS